MSKMGFLVKKLYLSFCLVLGFILSQSAFAEQLIDIDYYNNFHTSFCDDDISVGFCITRVSVFVAIKFIQANNDYYVSEIKRRLRSEGRLYNQINITDVKQKIINEIAMTWLIRGVLPVLEE